MKLSDPIMTADGNSVQVLRVYSQGTYLGVMLGSNEQVTQFILEDPKSTFVPEKWQKHEFVLLGIDRQVKELPAVVNIALLVLEKSDGTELVKVVGWFDDELFRPPDENIVALIASLDWTAHSGEQPHYYS